MDHTSSTHTTKTHYIHLASGTLTTQQQYAAPIVTLPTADIPEPVLLKTKYQMKPINRPQ